MLCSLESVFYSDLHAYPTIANLALMPKSSPGIVTATVLRTAASITRLTKKMGRTLHSLPAFRLVLGLLTVIVLLAVLGHYYAANLYSGGSDSNIELNRPYKTMIGGRVLSPNNYPFPRRQIEGYDDDGGDGLLTDPMGGRPLVMSYRKEVEDLKRIKASASNELREMEGRRLKLEAVIQQYQASLEDLKQQHASLTKEISNIKLTLDQIRFERDESRSYIPVIKAPIQVLKAADQEFVESDRVHPDENYPFKSCTMETCFDYSRCSLVSGFPVYFYNPSVYMLVAPSHGGQSVVGDEMLSIVQKFFSESVYRTRDSAKACIFIVMIGGADSSSDSSSAYPSPKVVEKFLQGLPHWGGDGRNHLLVHLTGTEVFDPLKGVNTGRAMAAKTTFTDTIFREGFDFVLPPNLGPSSENYLWMDLPPLSPIRRRLLLSYWGAFVSKPTVNETSYSHKNFKRRTKQDVYDSNDIHVRQRRLLSVNDPHIPPSLSSKTPYYHLQRAIVSSLEGYPTSTAQGDLLIDLSCDGAKILKSQVTNTSTPQAPVDQELSSLSDWALCGSKQTRFDILLQSTFSLVLTPLNTSAKSTVPFQTRILEALRRGSIPLVLGRSASSSNVLLPFSEVVRWEQTTLTLPVPRVTEVPFFLQSFSDEDIAAIRLRGRELYQKYLGSTDAILKTLLAVMRHRLNIPAHAVPDEPSPSAFPDDFTPLVYDGPDIEPETDEILGPIETPFASEMFRRNFSIGLVSDIFNGLGDPFSLYPSTPFQPTLPSEAKFLGSSYGFRPLNKGAGGDGIDFSRALGGNLPREQFTIVMLTYQREAVLIQALQRFKGLPFLNKVLVVWNSEVPPSPDLRWPQIGVPIKVIKTKKNSLNNRFLPYSEIETEAILSIDDDAHLRHDEIVFGFRVWREERSRIVGFPGRYHAWDLEHRSWNYNSNYSCELSMVLTGAAFFHKYYTYLYSYTMPQAIRDKVDEYLNCEDIAMNFLVSHITHKPPVKVTSRWTFRCPGCPTALFNNPSHFEERHKCINFFSQVYGYTPLLYTQYRVDSVLFKTRIAHDKTKCFKYI